MDNCRLWAWEGVSLEKHLCCTAVVAEYLYGRDWRWVVGGLGLWELTPALRVAALLHDIGKALHQPPSFKCHEVEGAVLLAAVAERLWGPGRAAIPPRGRGSPSRNGHRYYALLAALAGIAAYLHHHGMGGGRYRECTSINTLRLVYRWRRISSCVAPRLERAASIAASETKLILDSLLSLSLTPPRGGVIEACGRIVSGYLEGRGFRPGDPIAGRLATLITGFVSVADSIAALVEGRVERSIDCSEPKRYYDRVVCEMSGWSTTRARALVGELRDECTSRCSLGG